MQRRQCDVAIHDGTMKQTLGFRDQVTHMWETSTRRVCDILSHRSAHLQEEANVTIKTKMKPSATQRGTGMGMGGNVYRMTTQNTSTQSILNSACQSDVRCVERKSRLQ